MADIKAEISAGKDNFKGALEGALKNCEIQDITSATLEADAKGRQKVAGVNTVARGFIVLDVVGFALDLNNSGFKTASVNLMDPPGVARDMMYGHQCPPAACTA